jgi:hypothetical protein
VFIDDVLSARAMFKGSRPASSFAAITGRCNWWNSTHAFLKASADITTADARADDAGDSKTIAIARVQLDMEVPLNAGIAPVQLQLLLREIPTNVALFQQAAQLDTLLPPSAWPWG